MLNGFLRRELVEQKRSRIWFIRRSRRSVPATSCHDLVGPNLGGELFNDLELGAYCLSTGLFDSHDECARYEHLYCMLPIVSFEYMHA